jgi:predicted RNase H-like HicB family nuclease
MDILWHENDEIYVVFVHELPGCVAGGKTRLEAVQHTRAAIRQHVDELEAAGLPVPSPHFYDSSSGNLEDWDDLLDGDDLTNADDSDNLE